MDGRIIKKGPHRCKPPPWGDPGSIWECGCGRRWKFKNPGNPAYAGWRRLFFRRF